MRAVLLLGALLLCSCATIVAPGPDMVPVSSDPPGASVYVGSNPHPVATTPATLTLARTAGEFAGLGRGWAVRLRLEHDGCHPQEVLIDDVPNGWFVGNILFGGIIGLMVDAAASNTTKWPEAPLHVVLTSLDRPAPAVMAAHAATRGRASTTSMANGPTTVDPMDPYQVER